MTAKIDDAEIAKLIQTLSCDIDQAVSLLEAYKTADTVLRLSKEATKKETEREFEHVLDLISRERIKEALYNIKRKPRLRSLINDAPIETMRKLHKAGEAPDESDVVDRLVKLGYTEAQVRKALDQCDGDENEAAMTLLCEN